MSSDTNTDVPLSPGAIEENITRLKKTVSVKEDELNGLQAELEWWEKGQELFGRVPGEATDPLPIADAESEDAEHSLNGSRPPLRNRILTILGQEPRKTWKAEQVIDEMRERDWMPSGDSAEHHVRSMLAQMHRKGQARRMGRGMYRLPPERKD
jgi:hypothetical protein